MITHKVRIILEWDVHESINGKFSPAYTNTGRAIKVLDGESEEDCLAQVKKLISLNGFVKTKEERAIPWK
jgi:hypothetical protein